MIVDIGNCLWKSNFGTFWHLPMSLYNMLNFFKNFTKQVFLPIYSSNTAPNASEFVHMSHISWAHMWDSKGRGNTDTPTGFVPLIIGILMSPYHMLKLVRIIGQLINGITWTHMIWTSMNWFGKVSWACVYHHGSEKISFFIYYIYLNSSVIQIYVMYCLCVFWYHVGWNNASSFYMSQTILGWSKLFVPDQKMIFIQ